MGTPLGPKYIPYTYMDPLGYSIVYASKNLRPQARSISMKGLAQPAKRVWRPDCYQSASPDREKTVLVSSCMTGKPKNS